MLQNSMQSNSLFPTILTPTRVASVLRNGQFITTKTLIDNIYLNTQNNFKFGTLEVAISDHYPVFTFLSDYNVPDSKEDTIIKYRLINDITLRKFRYALENNIEINNPNTNCTAKIVFNNF